MFMPRQVATAIAAPTMHTQVKHQEPGFKLVEVEQCGELRVLWIHRVFKTYLDVTEDARDTECLKTEFTLLRSVSDMMAIVLLGGRCKITIMM
jgi:hypothetical protein